MTPLLEAVTLVYICALILLVVVLGVYLISLTITRSPFLSLSYRKIPEIMSALELRSDSIFYDLGCGDGRMVLAASTVAGRCTGIDYALAAYTLARFRRRRAGSPSNTTIRREDFLKADISDATHIFCYLFPPVMQDLHLKFQKELKPGTRVVSCDFPIVGKEPKATIPFKKQKLFFNKLGTTLYVYEY